MLKYIGTCNKLSRWYIIVLLQFYSVGHGILLSHIILTMSRPFVDRIIGKIESSSNLRFDLAMDRIDDFVHGKRVPSPLGHGSFYALAFPVALCRQIGSVAL